MKPYTDDDAEDTDRHRNVPTANLLPRQQEMMREQDESLDRLSYSVGRQHELSIQIGDELDGQGHLLDDIDGLVDHSHSRLNKAKRRLEDFSNKARENGELW